MSSRQAPKKLIVREPFFSQIRSGEKTVEGRIAKPNFRNIALGSQLIFTHQETPIATQVDSLHIYPNFRSMLEEEELARVLPGCESIDKGISIYEGIPGYAEKSKEFGVIAIRFTLANPGSAS